MKEGKKMNLIEMLIEYRECCERVPFCVNTL